ncbi:MAG: PilZ domain-containing protein [Pseudomonadota bacterium]
MIAPRMRADAMEHRWGQRITCRATVVIRAPDGSCGAGRLRDVSSSGAFVETHFAISVLASIGVTILREGDATAQREIRASVVRRDSDGIAVEWCETAAGSICTRLGCESQCAAATAPR